MISVGKCVSVGNQEVLAQKSSSLEHHIHRPLLPGKYFPLPEAGGS